MPPSTATLMAGWTSIPLASLWLPERQPMFSLRKGGCHNVSKCTQKNDTRIFLSERVVITLCAIELQRTDRWRIFELSPCWYLDSLQPRPSSTPYGDWVVWLDGLSIHLLWLLDVAEGGVSHAKLRSAMLDSNATRSCPTATSGFGSKAAMTS